VQPLELVEIMRLLKEALRTLTYMYMAKSKENTKL
jgi:hypothetical protein